MGRDRVSRRRLLAGVGSAGAAGVAGCLGGALESGGSYVCTDIDDEPTDRREDTPLPFTLEVPAVMSEEDRLARNNARRVTFSKGWKDLNPGGGQDALNHSVDLRVNQVASGSAYKPVTLREFDPDGTVLGKRLVDGTPVGLVERDSSRDRYLLGLWYPLTVDGERVFRDTTFRIDARFQGRQEFVEDARGDGPDQTCTGAIREVLVATVDSASTVSSAETETSLDISPSAASVRRGESVEMTVDAAGVEWVDLLVRGEEFDYLGTLAVDGSATVTVAPRTDDGAVGVVTTPDEDRLHTSNATDATEPGAYTVLVRAPGLNGLVRATASLTVVPAR